MKRILLLCVSILTLLLSACSTGGGSGDSRGANGEAGNQTIASVQDAQWNISILLDLSDRIDPAVNAVYPTSAERDLALVSKVIELFKAKMARQGVFKSKGHIRVIFSPSPQDAEVNRLAESLRISLEGLDNKEKKSIYDNIDSTYRTNLKRIYDLSIEQRKWVGSDIWRFFKDDVRNYCIASGYRNILFVLTDGYIYHKDSHYKEANRYSYLLAEQFKGLGLRTPSGLKTAEDLDFGLIATRQDLEDLEVLVMELKPSEGQMQDYDIMQYALSKWFKEMGVKRQAIYKSDLPSNTEGLVEAFFKE